MSLFYRCEACKKLKIFGRRQSPKGIVCSRCLMWEAGRVMGMFDKLAAEAKKKGVEFYLVEDENGNFTGHLGLDKFLKKGRRSGVNKRNSGNGRKREPEDKALKDV